MGLSRFPNFEPSHLIKGLPDGFIQSLYTERVSIEHQIESNIDGIKNRCWKNPDDCDEKFNWGCLPAQVLEKPSDRRDSERRDYTYQIVVVDIPFVIPVNEAMSLVWRGVRYKIISVVNDLDIATRIKCSLRIE